MIQFDCAAWLLIEEQIRNWKAACGKTSTRSECLNGNDISQIERIILHSVQQSKKLDSSRLPNEFNHIIGLLNQPEKCIHAVVASELTRLGRAIRKELISLKFAYIPPSKAEFFERDELFGEAVNDAFPSARANIKDAGNSLAADLPTAAVYHLMCVIELGLRALARKLKVHSVKAKIPIELGTWEQVITALESKIKTVGGTARSNKKQKDMDFYNGLLMEFRSIKDCWRNKVMHTRVDYDQHQALRAFDHVRGFMQRLAERVSE